MFRKITKGIFGGVASVGVAYVILAATIGRTRILELCFGPAPVQAVEFENLRLKPSPNQYLVCPPDLCAAEAHMESPVFQEPLESLRARWLSLMRRQPRTNLVLSELEKQRFTHRVKTALIHFPDDVTVQFIPLDDKRSTMAIYGRSHYGYSDLGANRRRIISWLRELGRTGPLAQETE
ncbi:MAG: DUF1499 domain-containing protein [Acidobacteria bacterium]|nr:DUF1499 domain-containing protein [Acidobacteriota bacterium]